MNRGERIVLGLASLAGLIGVCAGAFAAHGISDPSAKEVLRTGAQYQMIHALAAIAATFAARAGIRTGRAAGWLFLAGCLLFPGSLYLLALTTQRWAGPVTPLGGLCFIAGWAVLAIGAFTAKTGPARA